MGTISFTIGACYAASSSRRFHRRCGRCKWRYRKRHTAKPAFISAKQLDEVSFAQVMHINAAPPALLLAALKPSLQGKHATIIASLSARVGSITDNGYGGWCWYSYRASKAAHNMLLRTAAIELKRLNKQSIVLCLHPGTTDTPLSKPFQARVPIDW
ncbi:SDR family NAD(P)-dependent oxidoreductase [Vreelandella aquamarina]|uniref:SDR family NAD(P)-dependent oxidoreductase n=1 Tax=Vreelandella aquamarina TaxID=77097 RepID=UPI0036F3EDFC